MSNDGHLKINLDKAFFEAGDVFSGRVILTIQQPDVKGSEMKLKLTGFEKTKWELYYKHQNTPKEYRPPPGREEKHKIQVLKATIPLANFKDLDTIPVGTWEYPFQFQLSEDLPSSYSRLFDYHKVRVGLRAKIYYKAKVSIDKPGAPFESKSKFLVCEPIPKAPLPIHEEKNKSFPFSKGKLFMEAKIDKSVFVPGETIQVKLSVNNLSSKDVEHVKIKLQEDIKVQNHTFKVHDPTILAKKPDDELYRQTWEGVPSMTKKEMELEFKIKPEIQATTHGKLIKCDYNLEIECGVSMAGDLEIHPKIVIVLNPTFYSISTWKTDVEVRVPLPMQ